MEVNEAKETLKANGWTPRVLSRRNGIPYLYAARWRKDTKKTDWRYIGAISSLGEMTKEKILAKLNG